MNNKLIKWLMTITLFLLLLFWLLQSNIIGKKSLPINPISQFNQPAEVKTTEQVTAAQSPHDIATTIAANSTNKDQNNNDSERSYLTIYKELELAKSCGSFYKKNHQAKGEYDYISPLNQAANHQSRNQNGAPEVQKQAMENFVSACIALKAAVFRRAQIAEDLPKHQFVFQVMDELRKEFKQSEAVTKEEQHLAKSIRLSAQWNKSFHQLVDILRGQLKLDKSVRDMLMAEAQSITAQINSMYQSNQEIDPIEIQKLEQLIKNLYNQTGQRLPVDEAKKNQAMALFKPLNEEMEQLLLTSFPESFKAVIKRSQLRDQFNLKASDVTNSHWLTFINNLMPWFQPPSKVLQEYSQISDQQIFDSQIEPASLLYLCYLGDDCGADSAHVRHYCLGKDESHKENYSSACGKSLLDFFTEDYLSANQWLDISALFDVMVATYAP